ncbi:hypothetical protein [Corallococcus macrosporus]|uniref:hypothetical protein n=1 Tax=Corallococcus macrosporus TaxID=35 RepID=UPI0012FD8A98|nr:hypothetical protein [Corallococcus macrosporus]
MAHTPVDESAWQDDDARDLLQETLRKAWEGPAERMPAQCPRCAHEAVHAYFHARPGGRLGGCWVWCSSCRAYTHGSSRAPAWWRNLEDVEESSLTAAPVALDAMSARIDAHWNALRRGG